MEAEDGSEPGDSRSVPEPLTPFPGSAPSFSLPLSSDRKPLSTDRLGIVNCGMLSGVSIFGKRFSRLVWEPDDLKEAALPVAHKRARIPALLCLRAVDNPSGALAPPVIAPMLNVRVTELLSMSERRPLSVHASLEEDT